MSFRSSEVDILQSELVHLDASNGASFERRRAYPFALAGKKGLFTPRKRLHASSPNFYNRMKLSVLL